jgi:hypothetical protein
MVGSLFPINEKLVKGKGKNGWNDWDNGFAGNGRKASGISRWILTREIPRSH